MVQIEKGRAEAKEQAAEALAKQVAVATFAEINGMIERDLQILQQKLPGREEQAAENALDMKYLRERQANLCLWIELITVQCQPPVHFKEMGLRLFQVHSKRCEC